MAFLHGVKVTEVWNGARSVESVESSIIGIIGTAPGAETVSAASVAVGAGTSALTFTAKVAGEAGNKLAIRIVNPGTATASLDVSLTSKGGYKTITISLATDATKVATSTASEIKTAVEAEADAAALVTVTSGGSGVVAPCLTTYLSGGADEAFPIDTPVLITPSDGQWARLGGINASGSLARAIDNVWKQCGTPIVVVRVTQSTDDKATATAVAGSAAARTGAFAMVNAQSITGVKPRIIIAPGFGNEASVITSLESVCETLKAVAIIDGPNSTDADALNMALAYGTSRLFLVDPAAAVVRDEGTVYEPLSSFTAGLISYVDNNEGFWVSPSNHVIKGVVGLSRPIDFEMGEETSRANLLNAGNVTTVIRQNGFRLWGNRTLSADQATAFLCVRRTADIINDGIVAAHLWAVDRTITKNYVSEVTESVNSYLRSLIAQGALVGDQNLEKQVNVCWLDAELNSEASISAGKIYFDFAFTPPTPAERVEFRSEPNTNGLATILS